MPSPAVASRLRQTSVTLRLSRVGQHASLQRWRSHEITRWLALGFIPDRNHHPGLFQKPSRARLLDVGDPYSGIGLKPGTNLLFKVQQTIRPELREKLPVCGKYLHYHDDSFYTSITKTLAKSDIP